ncbi:MAG TPA: T9SS type A sorting domain-containing protein, partial [Chitinophagaceae bacterium]
AYLGGCETPSSKSITTTVTETKPTAPVFRQYPNPSNGTLHIEFNVAKAGNVQLAVYDLNGRLVSKIYEGYMEKGINRNTNFNTASLSSGVYITRLQTADGVKEQKLIVGK